MTLEKGSTMKFGRSECAQHLNLSDDLPFHIAFTKRDATLIIYKPHSPDRQTAHAQNELYFIASGQAKLEGAESEVLNLSRGDIAFVPAGLEHGFTDLSPDFTCWALFFGTSLVENGAE